MPVAAKAFFTVTAGIIPGELIREHCRQWPYTSEDYAADAQCAPDELTRFAQRRDEALAYAREAFDPRQLNWVTVEFIWV